MRSGSPGWTSLCLAVSDLDAAKRFYRALGMDVVEEVVGNRVVVRNGSFRIALMKRIDENVVNLRGANVTDRFAEISRQLPGLDGEPIRYQPEEIGAGADAAGTCWATRDPDGNLVLLDTNANEEGEAYRQRRIGQILEEAEIDLRNAGASEACLDALRVEVIERFGTGG